MIKPQQGYCYLKLEIQMTKYSQRSDPLPTCLALQFVLQYLTLASQCIFNVDLFSAE